MEAVRILCDGTVIAAREIMKDKGIDWKALDPTLEKFTDAVKAVLDENIAAILVEWKEATESLIGDGWLRKLVNVQCTDLAIKVLRRLEWMK